MVRSTQEVPSSGIIEPTFMKRLVTSIALITIAPSLFGQTCVKEEKTIRYLDGYEVFNICKVNPTVTFDDNKSYYWYNEYSKVKFTKGGVGGNLLNGNYKLFDKDGNLIIDRNYLLGLEHGSTTTWDSLGNITSKGTYDRGNITYAKYLNDDDQWIEFNGRPLAEGTVKKVYTRIGSIISEERMLKDFSQHVKIYYELPSGQLKEEYTTAGIGYEYLVGKYTSFYSNGRIEVEGQFFQTTSSTITLLNIRNGKWRWYNEDGSLDSEVDYKAEEIFWPNGKLKLIGGYIYDSENDLWVKIENWHEYDETGIISRVIKYNWGVEVSN